MSLELIDRFLYKGKIDLKFIKIQLREAKMSAMRVGSRTPATSKMEIFVTVVKEWKLSRTVTISSILEVTMGHRSRLSRLIVGIVVSCDD